MEPISNAKQRFSNGNGLTVFDAHPVILPSIAKLKPVAYINANTATIKHR